MLLNQRIEEWLKDTTQILNISRLGLTKWPEQLVGKEYLIKKLNCWYNKLTSLPNGLTNLKILDCSFNKLTSLPNNLTKLGKLICSFNKLITLPNGLTNLKTLDCSDNELTSLPNNLTNIETLYCSYNKLKFIPNNLTKLERLDCGDNELITLPNGLTNLEYLNCYENKLTSLPNDLIKLEKLYCSYNQLFSKKLEKWKKIWPISIRHQYILRTAGIKRVVKVLKNRLYLPSLNELREELLPLRASGVIWSPNHPGKFFTSLPRRSKIAGASRRVGDW